MKKYYDKDLPVAVHVTFGERFTGRTYREFEKLKKENKNLREEWDDMFKKWESLVKRIGKAIEYTEHIDDFDIKDFRRKELLNILKGSEE